eukprot:3850095-Prymnesium_polylepis.1
MLFSSHGSQWSAAEPAGSRCTGRGTGSLSPARSANELRSEHAVALASRRAVSGMKTAGPPSWKGCAISAMST